MNQSDKKGINVEISTADFIDRYVIHRVRIEKSPFLTDLPWMEAQYDKANLVALTLDVHAALIEHLYEIHLKLWELEDRIRSNASDVEFTKTAREIFDLNDKRHKIKATIDQLIPTRCSHIRIYESAKI